MGCSDHWGVPAGTPKKLNRMNAMRKTGQNGWDVLNASEMLLGVRLAAVAAGIAIILSSGMARAQDDGDNDRTFEENIVHQIMTGIGATNMENKGIEYRERSPLVIPPKLDLPPPGGATAEIKDPNWPKDPDIQRRKEAIAANKERRPLPWEAGQSILPSKLARGGGGRTRASHDKPEQATTEDPSLSPSQLGFSGKLSELFGGNTPQTAPFTGEPDREKLTQPPAGYQTPSPNFAYGTGPKEILGNKTTDVMTGKEVTY
jgi:hypothetical protein